MGSSTALSSLFIPLSLDHGSQIIGLLLGPVTRSYFFFFLNSRSSFDFLRYQPPTLLPPHTLGANLDYVVSILLPYFFYLRSRAHKFRAGFDWLFVLRARMEAFKKHLSLYSLLNFFFSFFLFFCAFQQQRKKLFLFIDRFFTYPLRPRVLPIISPLPLNLFFYVVSLSFPPSVSVDRLLRTGLLLGAKVRLS